MSSLSIPNDIINKTFADGTKLGENFTAIEAFCNGALQTDETATITAAVTTRARRFIGCEVNNVSNGVQVILDGHSDAVLFSGEVADTDGYFDPSSININIPLTGRDGMYVASLKATGNVDALTFKVYVNGVARATFATPNGSYFETADVTVACVAADVVTLVAINASGDSQSFTVTGFRLTHIGVIA